MQPRYVTNKQLSLIGTTGIEFRQFVELCLAKVCDNFPKAGILK